MKIKTAAIVAASTAIISTGANANPIYDLYAGALAGIGGASILDDGHTHSGMAHSFGGIIGIDIPFVRAEAEYSNLHQSDIKFNIAAINAYAKMPTTLVQPYLGAGIGIAFDGDVDVTADTDFKRGTVYQGMLGLTFSVPVLPLKADLEARTLYIPHMYKYLATDAEYNKPDAFQYEARLKLRYVF